MSDEMAQADLRRVERAAQRRKEADRELRVAIKLARAAGETQKDVASAAGLTPQRIAQIEHEQPGD